MERDNTPTGRRHFYYEDEWEDYDSIEQAIPTVHGESRPPLNGEHTYHKRTHGSLKGSRRSYTSCTRLSVEIPPKAYEASSSFETSLRSESTSPESRQAKRSLVHHSFHILEDKLPKPRIPTPNEISVTLPIKRSQGWECETPSTTASSNTTQSSLSGFGSLDVTPKTNEEDEIHVEALPSVRREHASFSMRMQKDLVRIQTTVTAPARSLHQLLPPAMLAELFPQAAKRRRIMAHRSFGEAEVGTIEISSDSETSEDNKEAIQLAEANLLNIHKCAPASPVVSPVSSNKNLAHRPRPPGDIASTPFDQALGPNQDIQIRRTDGGLEVVVDGHVYRLREEEEEEAVPSMGDYQVETTESGFKSASILSESVTEPPPGEVLEESALPTVVDDLIAPLFELRPPYVLPEPINEDVVLTPPSHLCQVTCDPDTPDSVSSNPVVPNSVTSDSIIPGPVIGDQPIPDQAPEMCVAATPAVQPESSTVPLSETPSHLTTIVLISPRLGPSSPEIAQSLVSNSQQRCPNQGEASDGVAEALVTSCALLSEPGVLERLHQARKDTQPVEVEVSIPDAMNSKVLVKVTVRPDGQMDQTAAQASPLLSQMAEVSTLNSKSTRQHLREDGIEITRDVVQTSMQESSGLSTSQTRSKSPAVSVAPSSGDMIPERVSPPVESSVSETQKESAALAEDSPDGGAILNPYDSHQSITAMLTAERPAAEKSSEAETDLRIGVDVANLRVVQSGRAVPVDHETAGLSAGLRCAEELEGQAESDKDSTVQLFKVTDTMRPATEEAEVAPQGITGLEIVPWEGVEKCSPRLRDRSWLDRINISCTRHIKKRDCFEGVPILRAVRKRRRLNSSGRVTHRNTCKEEHKQESDGDSGRDSPSGEAAAAVHLSKIAPKVSDESQILELSGVVDEEAPIEGLPTEDIPIVDIVPPEEAVAEKTLLEWRLDEGDRGERDSVVEASHQEARLEGISVTEVPIDEAHAIGAQAPITASSIDEALLAESHVVEAHATASQSAESPVTGAPALITTSPIDKPLVTNPPVDETYVTASPLDEAHVTKVPVLVTASPVDEMSFTEAPALTTAPTINEALVIEPPIDEAHVTASSVDEMRVTEVPASDTNSPIGETYVTEVPTPDTTSPVDETRVTEVPTPDTTSPVDETYVTEVPTPDTTSPVGETCVTEVPTPDTTSTVGETCVTEVPTPNAASPVDEMRVREVLASDTTSRIDELHVTGVPPLVTASPIGEMYVTEVSTSETTSPVDEIFEVSACDTTSPVGATHAAEGLAPVTASPADDALVTEDPEPISMTSAKQFVVTEALSENVVVTADPIGEALVTGEPGPVIGASSEDVVVTEASRKSAPLEILRKEVLCDETPAAQAPSGGADIEETLIKKCAATEEATAGSTPVVLSDVSETKEEVIRENSEAEVDEEGGVAVVSMPSSSSSDREDSCLNSDNESPETSAPFAENLGAQPLPPSGTMHGPQIAARPMVQSVPEADLTVSSTDNEPDPEIQVVAEEVGDIARRPSVVSDASRSSSSSSLSSDPIPQEVLDASIAKDALHQIPRMSDEEVRKQLPQLLRGSSQHTATLSMLAAAEKLHISRPGPFGPAVCQPLEPRIYKPPVKEIRKEDPFGDGTSLPTHPVSTRTLLSVYAPLDSETESDLIPRSPSKSRTKLLGTAQQDNLPPEGMGSHGDDDTSSREAFQDNTFVDLSATSALSAGAPTDLHTSTPAVGALTEMRADLPLDAPSIASNDVALEEAGDHQPGESRSENAPSDSEAAPENGKRKSKRKAAPKRAKRPRQRIPVIEGKPVFDDVELDADTPLPPRPLRSAPRRPLRRQRTAVQIVSTGTPRAANREKQFYPKQSGEEVPPLTEINDCPHQISSDVHPTLDTSSCAKGAEERQTLSTATDDDAAPRVKRARRQRSPSTEESQPPQGATEGLPGTDLPAERRISKITEQTKSTTDGVRLDMVKSDVSLPMGEAKQTEQAVRDAISLPSEPLPKPQMSAPQATLLQVASEVAKASSRPVGSLLPAATMAGMVCATAPPVAALARQSTPVFPLATPPQVKDECPTSPTSNAAAQEMDERLASEALTHTAASPQKSSPMISATAGQSTDAYPTAPRSWDATSVVSSSTTAPEAVKHFVTSGGSTFTVLEAAEAQCASEGPAAFPTQQATSEISPATMASETPQHTVASAERASPMSSTTVVQPTGEGPTTQSSVDLSRAAPEVEEPPVASERESPVLGAAMAQSASEKSATTPTSEGPPTTMPVKSPEHNAASAPRASPLLGAATVESASKESALVPERQLTPVVSSSSTAPISLDHIVASSEPVHAATAAKELVLTPVQQATSKIILATTTAPAAPSLAIASAQEATPVLGAVTVSPSGEELATPAASSTAAPLADPERQMALTRQPTPVLSAAVVSAVDEEVLAARVRRATPAVSAAVAAFETPEHTEASAQQGTPGLGAAPEPSMNEDPVTAVAWQETPAPATPVLSEATVPPPSEGVRTASVTTDTGAKSSQAYTHSPTPAFRQEIVLPKASVTSEVFAEQRTSSLPIESDEVSGLTEILERTGAAASKSDSVPSEAATQQSTDVASSVGIAARSKTNPIPPEQATMVMLPRATSLLAAISQAPFPKGPAERQQGIGLLDALGLAQRAKKTDPVRAATSETNDSGGVDCEAGWSPKVLASDREVEVLFSMDSTNDTTDSSSAVQTRITSSDQPIDELTELGATQECEDPPLRDSQSSSASSSKSSPSEHKPEVLDLIPQDNTIILISDDEAESLPVASAIVRVQSPPIQPKADAETPSVPNVWNTADDGNPWEALESIAVPQSPAVPLLEDRAGSDMSEEQPPPLRVPPTLLTCDPNLDVPAQRAQRLHNSTPSIHAEESTPPATQTEAQLAEPSTALALVPERRRRGGARARGKQAARGRSTRGQNERGQSATRGSRSRRAATNQSVRRIRRIAIGGSVMNEDSDDDAPLILDRRALSHKTSFLLRRLRRASSGIPDSELSVGELILRNARPRPKDFRRTRSQKGREVEAAKRRQELAQSMGGNVSADLLDIFADVTAQEEPAPESEPTQAANPLGDVADFAIFSGDAFDLSGGDDPFSQIYDVTEVHSSGKLAPFAKAYKKTRPALWDMEDDIKFYKALRAFGMDLYLISSVLKKYDMRAIKVKLKHEQKERPDLVEMALTRTVPLSTEMFIESNGTIDPSKHFDTETLFDKSAPAELKLKKSRKVVAGRRDDSNVNAFDSMFGSKGEVKKADDNEELVEEAVTTGELDDLFG